VSAPGAGTGPLLFARFAYPPNALGHCGPDAGTELLERVHSRAVDPDLRRLARGFAGAWPYLELIAHANGLDDPLALPVVEAYWLGNDLLGRVHAAQLGRSLEMRFRPVAGRSWPHLDAVVQRSPRPHHNFHVLCVYPWIGMLGTGASLQALEVLDRCRVRWGRVRSTDGPTAVVDAAPLTWDGRRLGLGPPRPESVTVADAGRSLVADGGALTAGDLVACHWGWACHRLETSQARRLRAETVALLDLVSRHLTVPPPAAVLG
jgi:hypothetical protein